MDISTLIMKISSSNVFSESLECEYWCPFILETLIVCRMYDECEHCNVQFGHCNVTNCILYMTISMEYNYRQYSNVNYAIYIMQYATCIYAICSIQYCNMKCAMSTLQCEMLTLPILQCLISAHVNLNMSFCTNSFDVL